MRNIFSITTIDLALFTVVVSAVSHSLEERLWNWDFPWKYMCPEAPPPPGSYPPGKSAFAFINMFHWCRSSDGGPACSCNQITGLPECGCDGPNRGMRFDFDSMTASYPCLNCLCVDMRNPGPHQGISGNTFPLGMLSTESGTPSTNEDMPQAQEQRVSGHGQRVGPSREAHSYEGVYAPRLNVYGGTRKTIITTGTTGPHMAHAFGPLTVTTGLGNVISLSRVGGHVMESKPLPANAHQLKGALTRSKAAQSYPGAGPSNPGSSVPSNGYTQSVTNPMGAHYRELFPMRFGTGAYTIEPAQRRVVRITRRPVGQEKSAASPAAGPAHGFPEWGAKARRTTQTSPRSGLSRALPAQSFDTLSRENPHQIVSDDELGIMHRVQMSGHLNQQSVNRLRVPVSDGGGGRWRVTDSTGSWNELNGSMDMD